MTHYRTVLFDLDGTLLDTLDDLADSANEALRRFGYPERDRETVRRCVGNGLAVLMKRLLPPGTDDDAHAAVSAWMKTYYAEHCAIKTGPYAGILPLLDALKARGTAAAVVTNKPEGAAQALCADAFGTRIAAVIGDKEGRRRKPEPDAVEAALAALGAEKDGAVYVGDSEVDVQTARMAGLPLIAVSWGFRDRSVLEDAGASVIADTPEELLALL